ncbi:MAG: AAA family ATPase [Pirellulaceae bacterium]
MSYWRYWNLEGAPFRNDGQLPLFQGETVEEALARIDFLVGNRRDLGLLTGASGVGKSAILRHVANFPPRDSNTPRVSCVRASLIGLESGDLFATLSRSLVDSSIIAGRTDNLANWNALYDYFQGAEREGVQTLVLLDDAESATAEGELDVCRLLAGGFPVTVVLAVEDQAASIVRRSLIDRVDLQVDLPEWSEEQTGEFLKFALSNQASRVEIFDTSAVAAMQLLSRGIPRRIVQIADLALVAGAVGQVESIDREIIEQATLELPKSFAA